MKWLTRLAHNQETAGSNPVSATIFKIKGGIMSEQLTNKKLAQDKSCTSRQISKSRKRGWIWVEGKKVNYTAPTAVRRP